MKLFFVLILILCAGCSKISPYETIVEERKTMTLLPCPSSIENPSMHSIVAIQSTIADVNWVVEKIDNEKKIVVAKVCVERSRDQSPDFLKRNDSGCASLLFSVKSNGEAIVRIPKKFNFDWNYHRDFDEWLLKFERYYAELRCYSDDVLKERATATKVLN